MKLYISADIEGSASIMDWDEALPGGSKFPYFTEIMTKFADSVFNIPQG